MQTFEQIVTGIVQALETLIINNGYWIIALIICLENAGIPLSGETSLIFTSTILK